MEKYRQFGDGGTGANPFVPVWSNYKSPLPVRAVKFLVLFPLCLLKLLIFSIALAWLAATEGICGLIPVGVLRYPLYRLFTSIGCGMALLGLNVIPADDSLADHRRLKVAQPKTRGGRVFDASRGTLVFANQQSFVDVLLLGLRLCPTFVFVASDGTPVQYGIIGALKRSMLPALPSALAKPETLVEVAKAAQSGWRGPVVVFAEGANTNGSCVLAWKEETFAGITSLEEPVGVALVSLTYSTTGAYTPHHNVNTPFKHIFHIAYQPWHAVRTQWLPASEGSTAIRGKPLAEQWPLVRTILTRMIAGAEQVQVQAERRADFLDCWNVAQSKGYTSTTTKKKKA